MDNQLFDFMKARFDGVERKLDEHREAMDVHIETDRQYWKVLDEQQAQLSLIKRVFWGAVSLAGTIGTYLGLKH